MSHLEFLKVNSSNLVQEFRRFNVNIVNIRILRSLYLRKLKVAVFLRTYPSLQEGTLLLLDSLDPNVELLRP